MLSNTFHLPNVFHSFYSTDFFFLRTAQCIYILLWCFFFSILNSIFKYFGLEYCIRRASLVAQRVKRLPAVRETRVQSLGREDPLEKGMATHSSVLTWRSPWTEEPGGLHYQSMGSQRVSHDWATSLYKECSMPFRVSNLVDHDANLLFISDINIDYWLNYLILVKILSNISTICLLFLPW